MVTDPDGRVSTSRHGSVTDVEAALRAIKVDGLIELPLDHFTVPVAAWLDELMARAEGIGLELTWTTRGDVLCVIDMEA